MENTVFSNLLSNKKSLLAVIGLIIVLTAIPITYLLTQRTQDLRQKAAEPQVCEDSPADIVLAIDKSPSMLQEEKFPKAKAAASTFVDATSQNSENRIALISYSNPLTTTTDSGFTNNFSSIKTKITALTTSGGTCISCAVKKINETVSSGKRQGIKNVAILLTDGQANQITTTSPTQTVTADVAEAEALQFVKEGFEQNKTVFFTIGLGGDVTDPRLGKGVNEAFLKKIASETGGKYYYAPSGDQLDQIYQEISQITGKGIISGFVYDDANKNTQFDDNESKLSDWNLTLTQGNSTVAQTTTDGNGNYTFTGLCDGDFTTQLEIQTGWNAINPENGSTNVTITQGSAANETNFGVATKPLETLVRIQAKMPGIGNATGDNNDPVKPIRTAEIEIFNLQNQKIKEGTGSAEFNGEDTYVGTIPLGENFTSGTYYAKVRFNNSLRSTVEGVHPITVGETNEFPPVTLISGDLDQNNILDLRDYNIFIACYGEKQCNQTHKDRADLNDNGDVDPVDYNILLRSFGIRRGSGATGEGQQATNPRDTLSPTPSSNPRQTPTPTPQSNNTSSITGNVNVPNISFTNLRVYIGIPVDENDFSKGFASTRTQTLLSSNPNNSTSSTINVPIKIDNLTSGKKYGIWAGMDKPNGIPSYSDPNSSCSHSPIVPEGGGKFWACVVTAPGTQNLIIPETPSP